MNAYFLATGLKMLVFYGYHSTDFEVHRNWMAIVSNLNIKDWYYNSTSIWTLDYPPFFAYFEYVLAQIAIMINYIVPIDLEMLKIENLNYSSPSTISYMRCTVLLSELITLGTAVYLYSKSNPNPQFFKLSFLLHPGLFIVDHIHFQYNGFLYGILLLSLYCIKSNRVVLGGCLFLILILFKHIFLYIALGYFAYYLKLFKQPKQLLQLASGFVLILSLALGPFYKDIPQVMTRLFPFKRGLVHALWAPYIWAIYISMDRGLCKLFQYTSTSMTRGIVGDVSFCLLPNISPTASLVCTLILFTICMFKFYYHYTYKGFIKCLELLALSSFLFGWHVHEKALLLPAMINLIEFDYTLSSLALQLASITSQLPLIYQKQDTFIHLAIICFLIALPRYLAYNNNNIPYASTLCTVQALLVLVCLYLRELPHFEFLHIMLLANSNAIVLVIVFINKLMN